MQTFIEIFPTIQHDGTAFVSLFLTVKRCVLYAKHLTKAERSNKKPKSGFNTHVTKFIVNTQHKFIVTQKMIIN